MATTMINQLMNNTVHMCFLWMGERKQKSNKSNKWQLKHKISENEDNSMQEGKSESKGVPSLEGGAKGTK